MQILESQWLGAVAIGRNEGERLRGCLTSLAGRVRQVVYVDSGSTDASAELARSLGAEVVELDFDPAQVSYEQLLEFFFTLHDPTTLNRQGPDAGSQYRSAIFFHTPEQEAVARASKEELERSGRQRRPIVTEILPAAEFWPAEEYHQCYLAKRGQAHCEC